MELKFLEEQVPLACLSLCWYVRTYHQWSMNFLIQQSFVLIAIAVSCGSQQQQLVLKRLHTVKLVTRCITLSRGLDSHAFIMIAKACRMFRLLLAIKLTCSQLKLPDHSKTCCMVSVVM